MIEVNISEAKANLSRYLDLVLQGETVILCRRNIAIAELRPVPRRPDGPRPVGIDKGMELPKSFFDPLPDDILAAFQGGEEP